MLTRIKIKESTNFVKKGEETETNNKQQEPGNELTPHEGNIQR